MSEKTAQPTDGQPGWWRKLQVGASLATILALLVAVVLAWRGERRKELELRYVAKQSVINPDAGRLGNLSVMYDGIPVPNLTKLSIRVVNTGDLPIESRDIEEPLTLVFDKPTVVSAAILSRRPAGIKAAVSHTQTSVRLDHGLLNAGDSIEIEVLCSEDVGWPADRLRISGVSMPVVRLPLDAVLRPNVAFFTLSRPVEYGLLSLAAVVPAVLLTFAGSMILRIPRWMHRWSAPLRFQLDDKAVVFALVSEVLENELGRRDKRMRNVLNMLFSAAISNRVTLDDLCDADRLAAYLEKSSEFREQANLTPQAAAEAVAGAAREHMSAAVKHIVLRPRHVPNRLKPYLEHVIRENENSSYRDFLSGVRPSVEHVARGYSLRDRVGVTLRHIEVSSIVATMMALLIGLASASVLAGSWASLLSAR